MKIEQEYELVALGGDEDVIKPHPQNPNQGDDDVVEESIDVNGWYGAVIAQRSTGYILAGHSRHRTALKKGAKEIPVIWKDVDDETALKILLVDNESARKAEMDEAKLEELLAGLDTLDGTGFSLASAQETLEAESNGSGEPELVTPPDSPTPDPDDIPDDVYTPDYGVMLRCKSEDHQRQVYEYLKVLHDEHPTRPIGQITAIQVVAV